MLSLLLIISFSQLQWKTLVLSTHLRQAFYRILVTKFVHHLARAKKLHSLSSASLFLFNVSILCLHVFFTKDNPN